MTSDLDRLVARVDCVLFDFDGPICPVFAGHPANEVAATLRTHLPRPMPPDVATTDDPMRVLAYATTVGGHIAGQVEAAMAAAEEQAIRSATATPGATEAIDAARRTGRRVGFVSNNSANAVATYVADHGLIQRGDIISARAPGNAHRMKPDPHFITQAVKALDVSPDRAVLVGDSTTDVTAAHAAEILAIGYVNKPGKLEQLHNAGPDHLIDSMHTLAQTLDGSHRNPSDND